MDLLPLSPRLIGAAFGLSAPSTWVERYAAWGGVPRYGELAASAPGSIADRADSVVLDPLGPLHREPDLLIAEEMPPALEVWPLLDAIGGGAHRVSEIGARIGRPATSLSRPLQRLVSMGLAFRETPFGENEKGSKRSLYRIEDPLTRLWFRMVAPHRGALAPASREGRRVLFERHWPGLLAAAWEQLCRDLVPTLASTCPLGQLGPWGPAGRWWRGNAPEWDLVALRSTGQRLLLGEVKLAFDVEPERRRLAERPPPSLPAPYRELPTVRTLFVVDGPTRPAEDRGPSRPWISSLRYERRTGGATPQDGDCDR